MREFIVVFNDNTCWRVVGSNPQDVRERYGIKRQNVKKLYPA